MFDASDDKQLKVLSKYFTREKSISDRNLNLEDAKEILGITDDCFTTNKHSRKAKAFQDLSIIIEALNEGWVPNFSDSSEKKWYNYFRVQNDVFSYSDTSYFTSYLYVPSALYLKNEELAKYCSEQYFDLYKEIYS